MTMSYLYLIHFDRPLSGRAQHYLGTAEDVDARIADHLATTWKRFDEPQVGDAGTWASAPAAARP